MADGLALAVLVQMRPDGGGGDGEVLVQEAEEVGGFFLDGQEFNAVAGGEDETFADSGNGRERADGVGEALSGDGEALANLDGCGVVIDAEENQRRISVLTHGVGNLWTAESWLAAQTQRTTMNTKLER